VWMKARSILTISALCLAPAASVHQATAHPVQGFTACAKQHRDAELCRQTVNNGYTESLYLRGRVTPPHGHLRARVWQKKPGERWERERRVKITDTGRMRWHWYPEKPDDPNDRPYRFQFRIPDHGRSNIVLMFIVP
jgi:hypothetical protein